MPPRDGRLAGPNLHITPAWRAKNEAELARLQTHYCDPILHARVAIIDTAHHHLGAFEVHLVLTVAGDTISVIRQGELVHPLLVEAFDVLDKRLRDHDAMRHQKVKAHAEVAQVGKVVRLFPERDYGFIEIA